MLRLFTVVTAICMLVPPALARTVADLESERPPISRFQAVADAAGVFRFAGLPAGEYDLRLTQAGFKRLAVKSIHVLDGEQKLLPVLQLAIGEVADCGGHAVLDYIRFLPLEDQVGNLSGTVRVDQVPWVADSPPVVGAEVTLICSTGACGATTTDSNGEFQFRAVPSGDFSVRVTNSGFYPLAEPRYTIKPGLESIYLPIYIERCYLGNCDPKLRPKKPLAICM
jgi:hypothetical protein